MAGWSEPSWIPAGTLAQGLLASRRPGLLPAPPSRAAIIARAVARLLCLTCIEGAERERVIGRLMTECDVHCWRRANGKGELKLRPQPTRDTYDLLATLTYEILHT